MALATSTTGIRLRSALAAVLGTGLTALSVAVQAHAVTPVRCHLPTPASPGDDALAAAGDCCSNPLNQYYPTGLTCPGDPPGGPAYDPAQQPNIVVVVSDDESYCQYSFMAGYCANDADRPCQSAYDCVGFAECKRRASGSPLRLNDPACRYRQRPLKAKVCNNDDNPDAFKRAESDGDKNAYPFQWSAFPCQGTPPVPGNRYPVSLTPHIDQLAAQGALFTHAYVDGNACKPSRAILLYGRHHRHLKYLRSVPKKDAPPSAITRLPDEYAAFLAGKGEVVNLGTKFGFSGGFEGTNPVLGKFECADENNCIQAVLHPEVGIPYSGRLGPSGVGRAMDALYNEEEDEVIDGESRQVKPFLMWFAPNIPHLGGGGEQLRALYDGAALADRAVQQFGRVSQLDLAVGALIDELSASCVCAPGATQPSSLWDNTVLIFVSDHGYYLPGAKHNSTEATHRTAMIISEPGHRAAPPSVTPQVYEDQFPDAVDLVKTILSYAGKPAGDPPDQPEDRYARNLKDFVHATAPPDLRDVVYGEDATQKNGAHGVNTSDRRSTYLIPRPGLIKLCTPDMDPMTEERTAYPKGAPEDQRHLRPCLDASDCASGSCSTTKRCINNPAKPCTSSNDCVAGFCDTGSGRCRYDFAAGTFGDIGRPVAEGVSVPHPDSRQCNVNGDPDCAPDGIELCRGPMLKVQTKKKKVGATIQVQIDKLWDLAWDPDQRFDLLNKKKGDPDYLGSDLHDKLLACLQDFDALDATEHWAPPDPSSICPWKEPAPTPTP